MPLLNIDQYPMNTDLWPIGNKHENKNQDAGFVGIGGGDFTTHGWPIGKTGRKNCEGKATQGNGMIYVNKTIPVPQAVPCN